MNLTSLGSVPQALATLVAAMVALRVSQNWKRQEIVKRRQAIAEEALTTVYQFVDALEHVRRPMVWAGEMMKDGVLLNSDEGVHYAIGKRLQEHKDTFAALTKAILITEVHFGRSASQQVREFYPFLNAVLMANNMLGQSMVKGYELDLRRKLERERQTYPGQDELGDKIKAATERLRATLKPHMRMPGEVDPDAPPVRRMVALMRFIGFGR